MNWINIKDKLPEEDEDCICYDGNEVFSGWFKKKYPTWDHDGELSYGENGICLNETEGSYISISDITHWMPLPPTPKEKDD